MQTTRTIAGVLVAAIASGAAAQRAVPNPLGAGPDNGVFQTLLIDQARVGALADEHDAFTLEAVPMPGDRTVDLVLESFDVLTHDAKVLLVTEGGEIEIGVPDVTLLRGHIAGDEGSHVFLSFSAAGTNGLIQTAGVTYAISSGAFGEGGATILADLADFPEPPEFAKGWECHVGPEHVNPLGLELKPGDGGGQRDNPCRIARIAIEGDYEFTAWLFGGDPEASAAYAVTLLGAVSEIYTRDLNVRLVVPFIRLWEDEADPYDGDKLGQFRNEWNANMRHVERDLAHLLSGNYGGGVAWVSVLCHNTYGYGLSGVGGSFPYPLRDHDHGNWDLMVVAHELGHNFGTLHTHDGYDPTIDDCGNGDCSEAWGGTIMSYCHTCPGGMSNIVIGFHPRVITHVSGYLDGACNILGDDDAYALDDEAAGLQDTPIAIDVLANDAPMNCSDVSFFTVQSSTDQGGTVEISEGTGADGRDEVVYSPAPGFVGSDTFFYIMETENSAPAYADVRVEVIPVRQADELGGRVDGVAIAYYELSAPTQLPDFSQLTPYGFDILTEVNFPNSYGNFATSGRIGDVGAVLDGLVLVPESAVYTIGIDSDEGSRLFIGEDLLIDNDGLHGMLEQTATIGLAAGHHRLRIEYFEATGRQGLITRIGGDDLPWQPIPASMWVTDHCLGDWVRDGDLNTIDFIAYLSEWSARAPSADLDDNGQVNIADFIAFLNAWAAGC